MAYICTWSEDDTNQMSNCVPQTATVAEGAAIAQKLIDSNENNDTVNPSINRFWSPQLHLTLEDEWHLLGNDQMVD